MLFLCAISAAALPWHSHKRAQPAPPSTSFDFLEKNGACVTGPILKIDPKSVTVGQPQNPPVTLRRDSILQVSQNNSPVYSARSSWADVEKINLLPRESLQLRLRNGDFVEGRPAEITTAGMLFRYGPLIRKRYPKAQIVTVDYYRVKPDSAVFDYFTQTAPALLFFYPDFYDRLAGLDGRVPVRLYNAILPEDDSQLQCAPR